MNPDTGEQLSGQLKRKIEEETEEVRKVQKLNEIELEAGEFNQKNGVYKLTSPILDEGTIERWTSSVCSMLIDKNTEAWMNSTYPVINIRLERLGRITKIVFPTQADTKEAFEDLTGQLESINKRVKRLMREGYTS